MWMVCQIIAQNERNRCADTATGRGDDTQDANSPTDVSHASGSHNQIVVRVNEAPFSTGGGELPPPKSTDVNSPRMISFKVKTDIFLNSTFATNGTSTNPNAYQNIQVNGSVLLQVNSFLNLVNILTYK